MHTSAQDAGIEPKTNLSACLSVQAERTLFEKAQSMIDKKCLASGVPVMRRFAEGIGHDYDAIRAALQTPYINGMVECHVNRRKNSEAPDVWTCRLSTASRACAESLFLHTRTKSGPVLHRCYQNCNRTVRFASACRR